MPTSVGMTGRLRPRVKVIAVLQEAKVAGAISIRSDRPRGDHSEADGSVVLPDAPDPRAASLIRAEPSLRRLVDLARKRLRALQVWLFGSRARGDARPDSDWDIWLILPNDAPDADLDPATAWRIGRDAGLIADVVADREEDVLAAVDVVNTLAFVIPREGIRLA
nr:nucleotidyltransferase domain-containing protein [uncultured Rhodopila sp.]